MKTSMLFAALAITSPTLVGCASQATSNGSAAGAAGAADSTSPTSPTSCGQQYITWMDQTYVQSVASGLSISQLATEAMPCAWSAYTSADDLGLAYDTWQAAFVANSMTPYLATYNAALSAFQSNVDGELGNYDAFLAGVAVTDAQRQTANAFLLVRPPSADVQSFTTSWAGTYATLLEQFGTPVTLPGDATGASARESYWDIDAGESDYLALWEGARPTVTTDGAFAGWMTAFQNLLYNGTQSTNTADDYQPLQPSFGCDLDGSGNVTTCPRTTLVQRFIGTMPPAVGDSDSSQWMSTFSLAIETGDPTNANDQQQLAFIEQARPTQPQGAAAYKKWLDVFATFASNDDLLTNHVLPAKPCTNDASSAQDFSSATASLTVSADVIAEAAPASCP